MKTQKNESAKGTSKAKDTKKPATEMKKDDMKNVKGGSGILSGGNDLTNVIQGGVGISNSSSGSHNGNSYTSNDDHQIDLGLGNVLENTNY